MAEPLKKEQETETLEEWYSKVYDYDPTTDDLKKAYGKDFDRWLKEI
jgi:hypothetical protein